MVANPLANRSVLVTGGTGSFGRAFVARALNEGARRVAVLSRDELKQSEMAAACQDERLRFFLGSVTDRERLMVAMRGVDVVVHAAAMKQVPACEQNPRESKRTNIDGAEAVSYAAIESGVLRAVFLSTDKAASPNTVYGSHKLAAERAWTQSNVYAAGTRTRLVATRYGNVLGSRGSVVPVFRGQAEKLGELTITSRQMTRFWMTLTDAVRLVELAIGSSRGGEVFIPKVGSCDILTVAEAVAPGVPWRETGIRRGEKLHETLIGEDEARDSRDYGDHYRIEPERTWEYLPEPTGTKPAEGFVYRSDINPWRLSVDDLRGMLSV